MKKSLPMVAIATLTLVGGMLSGCATEESSSAPGQTPAHGSNSSSGSNSGGGAADKLDACSLITADQASTLIGETLDAGISSTIADGQDQCSFHSGTGVGLTVIVYEPSSGVSWSILLGGSSADRPVSGVGDKAMTDGAVELDVQTGQRLVAVQTSSSDGRIAVAKALVDALK